jgi:hypothetical protein
MAAIRLLYLWEASCVDPVARVERIHNWRVNLCVGSRGTTGVDNRKEDFFREIRDLESLK